MLPNLVIGSTSQLAYYFPTDYIRLDSINIDLNYFKDKQFDSVYLCFANQRTYDLSLTEKDFTNINVDYTIKVLDHLNHISNRIVLYGTCELWNDYNSAVSMHSPIKYKYSPYIKSKEILLEKIKNLQAKGLLTHVIFIHPFNFNSIYRKPGFLFHKIFDALINNKQVKVGDLAFRRDVVHAKYVAKQSITATKDCMIGSGFLMNIEFFVETLFKYHHKDYRNYLIIDRNQKSNQHKYWYGTNEIYLNFMNDVLEDLKILMVGKKQWIQL